MKLQFTLFALSAVMLVSCGGNNSPAASSTTPEVSGATSEISSPTPESSENDYQVKWATPTGAPTLAFYDQAENENWFSSSNPASDVLPHFADQNFDAIVFDGIQGLSNIKANHRDYQLAKWISGGTFYVVSLSHDETYVPSSQPRIYSFMPQGNVSKALRDLAKNQWNWGEYSATTDEHITYGSAVSDIQKALAAFIQKGSIEGDEYDYYVLAQPVYSAMSAQFAKAGLPFHSIYDMQAEFSALHEGAELPAAAIFVNKTSYSQHKDAMDQWLAATQKAMDVVATDLSAAIEGVKKADSDDGSVNTKFGVTSNALNVVKAKMGNDKNAFNYRTTEQNKDSGVAMQYANAFQKALGAAEFDKTLFLN